MRILSNLAITGSINSSGMILLPKFVSASDVSSSYSSSFGGAPDRLAMFTFQDLVPRVIGPGDINTEIGCKIKNRLDQKFELALFYNCLVTSSRNESISPFSLDGTSIDKSGSIYSGSERRNYSSGNANPYTPGSISHRSIVEGAGEPSNNGWDFTLVFNLPGGENRLEILIDCATVDDANLDTLKEIANRFLKLFCNCLNNGEFIDLKVTMRCGYETGLGFGGFIRFEKCFNNCKAEVSERSFGIKTAPILNESGSSISVSSYPVRWEVSSFDYALTTITGSESAPSASGELTASTTPYIVIPSAPASPQTYYPFAGVLSGSSIDALPGLLYFNQSDSNVYVYNGEIWSSVGGQSELSRFTQSVGDGTASMFVVTHSKNTRDVMVTVRETNPPYDVVYPDVNMTSANTVRVDFSPTIPSSNQYTIVII
jgi:hypothetical protein